MNFATIKTVGMLGILALLSATATAAPVIDGRALGAAEGYQYSAQIAPSKDADKVPPATVFFAQDAATFDLSVAVIIPLQYVDNTYGIDGDPATHTHFTWQKEQDITKAKEDDHKFNELVGSDKVGFEIALPGASSSSFILDYISFDSMSNMWVGGTALDTGRDDDGVVSMAATSLQYNLNNIAELTTFSPELTYADPMNPGETEYTTVDANLADWIFEVVYEFKIDGSYFNNTLVLSDNGFINGFDMVFDQLHASPHKVGEFNDGTPEEFSALIPTPSSAGMGLFLLVGLAARGLRRKD
ncbi:hypothetical protein HED60_01735 [Planctomycetales bacterium ZRK34]|nr:hypothetical protein HED60_01735 [Planctomycetales bacterium ZRK34]